MIKETKMVNKVPLQSQQRKKIWSIHDGWVCSVLGVCFRRSELRKMARKKLFGLDPEYSDYLLHSALVNQVGSRTPASRALHKMLDRKYRVSINRYARVNDDLAIQELWEEDLRHGNVPGAYWAIMTHPAVSEQLAGEIYGQVHMMGHDIHGEYRRDNKMFAALREKVSILEEVIGHERQQHIKEKKSLEREVADLSAIEQQYIALKAEITRLKAMVDRDISAATVPDSFKRMLDDLRQQNASLCGRVDELTTALEDREDMLKLAQHTVKNLEKIQEQLKSENEELRQEIISLETTLILKMSIPCDCATCEDQDTDRCPGPDLCGKTVLYVGGRQNLVPMYKRLIEKHGGRFLHHDGGVEIARAKLPKMVTSADVVVCPVDCVSHDACNCVKKICKRYRKPFAMMRSSGLSSLVQGLCRVAH